MFVPGSEGSTPRFCGVWAWLAAHTLPPNNTRFCCPPPPPFVFWCVLVPRGVTSLHVNQFVSPFFVHVALCVLIVFFFLWAWLARLAGHFAPFSLVR